jgi:hypothetical protein
MSGDRMEQIYPWYESVNGNELDQGDLFFKCPIFLPDKSWQYIEGQEEVVVGVEIFDVVVMTQSCDLAHDKIDEVIVCPHWDINERKLTKDRIEQIRKGHRPNLSLLSRCDVDGIPMNARVVDFSRVFSLPKEFVRDFAATQDSRLRLLPPYREHLSQAFARFFMRVGLPQDIEL